MSLIPGLTLDAATQAGLERLIAQIPDAATVEYAHGTPAFSAGGFRANRPSNIRMRIGQLVKGAAVIEAPLRRLLAQHSLNATVVAPLSVAFLNDHASALADLFGAVPMRLARLLDERPEVREREGERTPSVVAAVTGAAGDPERTVRGARILHESLARLLEAVLADLPAGEGGHLASGGVSGAAQERQEGQLKEARQSLRELKGIESKAQRLQKQVETCQADLKRAQAAQVAAEGETRALRNRALQSEAELKRYTEQAELQVARLVEVRLAQEFAGWLGGTRAAVAAAAAGLTEKVEDDPLLRRAADALAAQAQSDRVSGTRMALRERLEGLEAMLARCHDALGRAMRPQSALQASVGELSVEIERLRGLLGLERPGTLEPALTAVVNSSSIDALPRWRATVEALGVAGVLDASAHTSLQAALRLRQAMLELEAAPASEAKADELESPVGRLRAVLRGQLTGVLLVDGHNALFALQARYRRPQDHNYPDRQARDWLIGDLVRAVASHPTCRVRIVFDGPERSDLTASSNVGVVFSGGTGEHRADKVLIEEIRFFCQARLDAMLLVTNDSGLAAEGARLGALPLAPVALLPIIG